MIQKKIKIINKLGLHARATAKFVACARRFLGEIQVKKGEQVANGKSIMGVMMLSASQNTELELCIEGQEAQDMMDALVELIESRFGEAS